MNEVDEFKTTGVDADMNAKYNPKATKDLETTKVTAFTSF